MVTVRIMKTDPSGRSLLLPRLPDRLYGERGDQGADLIATAQIISGKDATRILRIQRQGRESMSHLYQVSIFIQSLEVVEDLQSAQQSEHSWRLHEIELQDIR